MTVTESEHLNEQEIACYRETERDRDRERERERERGRDLAVVRLCLYYFKLGKEQEFFQTNQSISQSFGNNFPDILEFYVPLSNPILLPGYTDRPLRLPSSLLLYVPDNRRTPHCVILAFSGHAASREMPPLLFYSFST